MSPATYNGFRKVVGQIIKNLNLYDVVIRNSSLVESIDNGSTVVIADFYSLLKCRKSFSFQDAPDAIRKMKEVGGNGDVRFIRSLTSCKIEVNNNLHSFELDTVQTTNKVILSLPEKRHYVGKRILIDDLPHARRVLRNLNIMRLMVYGDELMFVYTKSGGRYYFQPEREIGEASLKIIELKSNRFLMFNGHEAHLTLARDDLGYWLITNTKMGYDMNIIHVERFT